MAYSTTGRLPTESASKLGHLSIIQSHWVQTLIRDFEDTQYREGSYDVSLWNSLDIKDYEK